MMKVPNPLSQIPRAGARLTWGPNTLATQPEMAALATQYIGIWSHILNDLNRMVASFLDADFVVVTALLEAVQGQRFKDKLRKKVVKLNVTDPEHLKLYEAAEKKIDPITRRRNDFVHHLWAVAPEFDEPHLALINPDSLVHKYALQKEYWTLVRERKAVEHEKYEDMIGPDHSEVVVYRESDFKDKDKNGIEYATEVAGTVRRLSMFLPPRNRERWRQFSEGPQPPDVDPTPLDVRLHDQLKKQLLGP